ncbi:hypothetical protein SDC9_198887 [bioreactor metagenome]|uniref:Uncharacterized protein n=1 Tax=bioreactor metagenome TaxID=1076179 RepID=A0A645IIX7_9ZZZZ
MARRDFHRRLVGFHGDQALLCPDGVAGLHQHFDHAHFVEVADVGDLDVDHCHVRCPFTAGCGDSPPAPGPGMR